MTAADILKKAEAARAAVMEARKERLPTEAKSPPGGGKRRGWMVQARRSSSP